MTYNLDYEYQLTQLDLINSKLAEHKRRVSLIKDVNEYYLNYFELVQKQKESNPAYSKWEPTLEIYLPKEPNNQDRLNVLTSAFTYTGIKKKDKAAFYEFACTFNKHLESYPEYQFLYFEVNNLNTSYLSFKLPSLVRWDVSTSSLIIERPLKFQLIESSVESFNHFYTFLIEDSYHPFIPGFYFSGRTVALNNGVILYEYFDDLGIWGIRDALYLSPLRPNIDFPLGHPKAGHLEIDEGNLIRIGFYPEYGNNFQVGKFTGYKTTDVYNPYKTFYLYEREDNTSFLLDSPPNQNAESYATHSLLIKGKEPTFYISPEISTSSLTLTGQSQENLNFIFDEV